MTPYAQRIERERAMRKFKPRSQPMPARITPSYQKQDCVHRGEQIGESQCRSCKGKVEIKIFSCRLHGSCTLKKNVGFTTCSDCQDIQPETKLLDFHLYNRVYADAFGMTECWLVGSGKTQFDYQRFSDVDLPIFMINAAGHVEQYAKSKHTYFMALDKEQEPWLGRIKGTCVLSKSQTHFKGPGDPRTDKAAKLIWFNGSSFGESRLLALTRDQLAVEQRLYRGKREHSGTIMPLLHFVWYLGFERVNCVGVDGLPDAGYDPRLPNLTGQTYVKSWKYANFRREQDMVADTLGLSLNYIGTP